MKKLQNEKVEIVHPQTGRRMNIDATIYDTISKAIIQTLKKTSGLTWTELAEGVRNYLKQENIKFTGSADWYAISIKHDLETKGKLEVYTEKGKKKNRLKN